MKETGKKAARVFDFDDTLLGREWPTRLAGLALGVVHPQHLPSLTRDEIAKLDLNHERVEGRVKGWRERKAFEAHAKRRVYPGVREELERLQAEGVEIFGNTGRPNKGEWVDMTYASLDKQGIGEFFRDKVAFTPRGVKTAVSKGHNLHQLSELYGEIEQDEDDGRTVRFLAGLFPDVTFNYVQYGTTGLLVSRAELDALPNVRRAPYLTNENPKKVPRWFINP